MLIKIRTWNMNFWLNPIKKRLKTDEEFSQWIDVSSKFLSEEIWPEKKDLDGVNFYLLQEASYRLYDPEFVDDKTEIHVKDNQQEVHYYKHDGEKRNWGLIIKSIGAVSEDKGRFSDTKVAFMCYNFRFKDNKIITIINLYAKTNEIPLIEIFKKLEVILKQNENNLIIIAGDFNASDKFPNNNMKKDGEAFDLLRQKYSFVDCTEKIPLLERSTMIDANYNNGNGFQNDYIFMYKPKYGKDYNVIDYNLKLYGKENNVFSKYNFLYDHFPVDIYIEL